ncbi:MAG TPA: secretin N-terminal domain-containing protein [bacterium]|nr:secretin N-terminal domain-containing protein [bacterium]
MSLLKTPLKYRGLIFAASLICFVFCGSVFADDIEIDLGATPTVAAQTKSPLPKSAVQSTKEVPVAEDASSASDSEKTGPASINKINVSSDPLGALVLVKGNIPVEPTVEKISDKKLLVKFQNTALSVGARLKFDNDFVKTIRSAVHGNAAWVVLDVNGVQTWKMTKVSAGYELLLQSNKAQRANPKSEVLADNSPETSSNLKEAEKGLFSRLIETSFKPLDKGIKLVLTSDQPSKYTFRKLSQPEKLVLRFHATKLEVAERVKKFSSTDVEFVKGGLISMELRQIGPQFSPIAEVILTLVPGTLNEIDRDLNQVVITLAAPVVAEKPVERKADINQLVSMDIQNADINAVLRTLASEAGFDVDFVAGALSGTVNEKFENVPLKTALSNLLAPGAYDYEVQGNRIRVATQSLLRTSKISLPKITVLISPSGGMTPAQFDTLVRTILNPNNASISAMDVVRNVIVLNGTAADVEDYKKTISDLKLGSDSVSDRITKVVKLNYSDPTVVSGILTAYLTPAGKVQIEPRTTSLIIWETATNMGVLLELVKELDIKSPQVLIESNIVEVDKENDLEFGFNWNLTKTTGDPTLNGSFTNTLQNTAVNPAALAFGTVKGGLDITGTLNALETKKLGKVISRPRVATASGVPAEIDSIENFVYTTNQQTVGLGGVVTNNTVFNTLPLPVDLKITPRITNDGRITTIINANVTSQTGAPSGPGAPPPTSVQTATSTITIKNGETIVMGGLVRDTIQDVYNGVPLLMNLPLIGDLFQQKTFQHTKVELVIFITPTIIQD